MVVAALAAWHERHPDAAEAISGVRVLPEHVLLEAYSVLTRLPGGLAVQPAVGAHELTRRFPEQPLGLPGPSRANLLRTLASAGIGAGATYDGLIALEALAHGYSLLSLDVRAAATYRRLGVTIRSP